MAAPVNTIATELQLVTILETVMRAFKRRLLPLVAFSTVFRNVQLQGTNEVAVPYYPLDTDASTDFDPNVGYVTNGSNGTNVRNVTVNKRKYMSLSITSSDYNRQPQLRPDQLLQMRAEKLAEDVIADIFSNVTKANFGASVCNIASTAFNSDNVTDIRGAANAAMWPKTGRSLILNDVYDTALFKDGDVKLTYAVGSDQTIREGEIGRLLGFSYHDSPVLPDNGEGLCGVAAFPSALLIACSPITPHPDVRARLSRYEVMSDEETGMSLEYRAWGEAGMDTSNATIEFNYGSAFGEQAAILRLTDPSQQDDNP